MTLPVLEPTKKSFWSRPEGKVGLAINIAVGAAIFAGWGYIVPFVLAALVSTLHAAVVGTVLAALLYVLFDKNFRRAAWYLYRSALRKFTGWFVNLDPIGILKSYCEKLEEKKQELVDAVREIRGQRLSLERAVAKNRTDYESSLRKLDAAKRQLTDPDPAKQRQAGRIVSLESKQVERLSRMLETQEGHQKKYNFIVEVLTRYGEVCDDTMADMKNEIEYRSQEREQARSFNKGMSAALGIMRGLPDDQEMYDMALDTLERDYTQKMGEVENALDLTKNVILQADFNDVAALSKADELLNKWKGTNSEVQLSKNGATKQSLIAAAEHVSPEVIVLKQSAGGAFDKAFD